MPIPFIKLEPNEPLMYITLSHCFIIAGQFLRIGWKMVMLGDETWIKLFPGLFTRHDGVSSFFVSLLY